MKELTKEVGYLKRGVDEEQASAMEVDDAHKRAEHGKSLLDVRVPGEGRLTTMRNPVTQGSAMLWRSFWDSAIVRVWCTQDEIPAELAGQCRGLTKEVIEEVAETSVHHRGGRRYIYCGQRCGTARCRR